MDTWVEFQEEDDVKLLLLSLGQYPCPLILATEPQFPLPAMWVW